MQRVRWAAGMAVLACGTTAAMAQLTGFPDPTVQQPYALHRSSSREVTGGNADYRTVTPGQTMTVLDVDGPGEISHIWYVWVEAAGHGQFLGVTMSVLQNQDMWWGEGNDRFEIDEKPAEFGTGSENYFLGAWDFETGQVFPLHGSPAVGHEVAGARSAVSRFHLDAPIPFLRA